MTQALVKRSLVENIPSENARKRARCATASSRASQPSFVRTALSAVYVSRLSSGRPQHAALVCGVGCHRGG